MSTPLDLKELDLDSFLDPSFDDLASFPWNTMPAAPATGSGDYSASSPVVSVKAPLDFAFSPSTQRPPQVASLPQQHRLLTDKGLAYTLPELTMDTALPQNGQPPFGSLLAATLASSERRAGTPDSGGGPHQQSKEHLSSSGSGELHNAKGKTQPSLAERNKQAQRRHRQRQRDRLDLLEAQVRKLNEEKQALVAEKAALAGQAAVLTQVLQMRDEQLAQMQPRAGGAAAASSDDSAESSKRESAVSSGLAESLSAILTLTVRENRRIHLKPEEVKAMTPQDVSRLWAEYMSALMKELAAVDGGGAEAAGRAEKRISQLVQEVLVLLMRYALGDLRKMKQFVVGKVSQVEGAQSQPPVGLENSEMWRAAARNLSLSEPQKRALCQLRRLFLQKHDALIGQRRDAMTALQHTIPSAASSHDMAQQFLHAESAMERLHENLRMENQLIVDLIYTLFVKVASPVQAARCMVQSFPWYPDSLCILTWTAAEAGDAQAAELLQVGGGGGGQHSEQDSAGEALSPSQSL